MKRSEKIVWICFTLGFFLSSGLVLVYRFHRDRIEKTSLSGYCTEEAPSISYEIEEINEEAGYYYIFGWAMEEEIHTYFNFGANANIEGKYCHNHIALVDGDDVYVTYSVPVKRNEEEETEGRYTYRRSGVKARVKKSALDKREYTVAIILEELEGEKHLLLTNKKVVI